MRSPIHSAVKLELIGIAVEPTLPEYDPVSVSGTGVGSGVGAAVGSAVGASVGAGVAGCAAA